MKWLVIVWVFMVTPALAQEPVTLNSSMFGSDFQSIQISEQDGWWFRQGDDQRWAQVDVDLAGWQKLQPSSLNLGMADEDGRVEGWFRFKFRLDSSFGDLHLGLKAGTRGASELYIDGVKIATYGKPGTSLESFEENHPGDALPTPVILEPGIDHLLAVHFVDYRTAYPPYRLRSEAHSNMGHLVRLTGPDYSSQMLGFVSKAQTYIGALLSVAVLLSVMFWMLAFQNRTEGNIAMVALFQTTYAAAMCCAFFARGFPHLTTTQAANWEYAASFFSSSSASLLLLLLLKIFNRRITLLLKVLIVLALIDATFTLRFFPEYRLDKFYAPLFLPILIYYLVTSWRSLKGAQWVIVAGVMGLALFICYYAMIVTILGREIPNILLFATGAALVFPLSLVVFVAMRFKEILLEVKTHATEVIHLSEEKKENAIRQQEILQQEVARQTVEISKTLENLKATQSQLIHQEKMAGLGELTAGIAHEIQNPLNFVNNFSEVNAELIEELKKELADGRTDAAIEIARDIADNEQKINQHGKRADGIVKSMLQHSRKSAGQKELTDINALCDEFLRLSYHGLRAKDKSFNAKMESSLDPELPKVSVVPQDLGRVILNLVNNAFYAVSGKAKQKGSGYEPTVTVSTKKLSGKIEIRVTDNGNGIPEKVKEKIFQPFFTTKPAGQGTGLGLSLAYDIVQKGHGGELKVESTEGEGSVFTIILPIQ